MSNRHGDVFELSPANFKNTRSTGSVLLLTSSTKRFSHKYRDLKINKQGLRSLIGFTAITNFSNSTNSYKYVATDLIIKQSLYRTRDANGICITMCCITCGRHE